MQQARQAIVASRPRAGANHLMIPMNPKHKGLAFVPVQ